MPYFMSPSFTSRPRSVDWGSHMIAARVVVVRSLLGPVAEAKLRARGIRALCPMYPREIRRARRVEVRLYPLYSTYMFAWVEEDQMRSILAVHECVDVLRKAGDRWRSMAVVPDNVISALSYQKGLENFELGDRVSVTHGRWEGLTALYSHSQEERVFLLFQMLGREVELPFHRSEISKTLLTG